MTQNVDEYSYIFNLTISVIGVTLFQSRSTKMITISYSEFIQTLNI